MTRYAVLFPGQGSQNKNMFESYEKNTIFNECITQSSQILGYDISKTIQDDSKPRCCKLYVPLLEEAPGIMYSRILKRCFQNMVEATH